MVSALLSPVIESSNARCLSFDFVFVILFFVSCWIHSFIEFDNLGNKLLSMVENYNIRWFAIS